MISRKQSRRLAVLIVLSTCAPLKLPGQTPTQTFHAFKCSQKTPEQLKKILEDILPTDNGVTQVITDPAQNLVLVRGSDSTVKMAGKIIKNVDRPPVRGAKSFQGATQEEIPRSERDPSCKPSRFSRRCTAAKPRRCEADSKRSCTAPSVVQRQQLGSFAFAPNPTTSTRTWSARFLTELRSINRTNKILQFHLSDGRFIELAFDRRRQGSVGDITRSVDFANSKAHCRTRQHRNHEKTDGRRIDSTIRFDSAVQSHRRLSREASTGRQRFRLHDKKTI